MSESFLFENNGWCTLSAEQKAMIDNYKEQILQIQNQYKEELNQYIANPIEQHKILVKMQEDERLSELQLAIIRVINM